MLRVELTRTLGLEWPPVRNGIAELVGVPKPLLRAFSRRRAEIEAAMAARGTSGPRAAEAAALATRQGKQADPTIRDLETAWRERAAELGFDHEDLAQLLARGRGVQLDAQAWEHVFAELASPLGLTRRASTFSRRDVVQALCERIPAGTRANARAIEAAADRFLTSAHAVALLSQRGEGEAYRRRDGRLLPIQRDDLVYSTPELLALEQRLIERVGDSSGAGVAGEAAVGEAGAARPTLSREQRAMLERLCLDGDGVSVVVGKAGTGKTFALAAAREAWQTAGHPVLGVAVARRAARELEQDAGIASTSVAALLGDLKTRGPTALPERCVLVVDEAGMVPTRQLAELLDAAAAVRGKLVLVGDHRQLPELAAGGAFRGLVQRGLAVELTENHRQVNAWERAALDHLRDGRAEAAVALYQQYDRVSIDETPERSRARLVAAWWAVGDPSRSVMLAQRRDDVGNLNARAREHMRAAGRLGEQELRLPGGSFAVGDHAIAKRNDLQRGIVNGERGRVIAVDPDARRLTLDCHGAHVTLDADYLDNPTAHGDPTLLHGYAMTVHVAQGLTVDHAFVLAGPGLNRELGYTALSRGRHTNRLYAARNPDTARLEYAPTDPHRRRPDRAPGRPARDELGHHARDRHRARANTIGTARRRRARTRPSLCSAPRRRDLARTPAPRPPARARAAPQRRGDRRPPRRGPTPPAGRTEPRRAPVHHRTRTRRAWRADERSGRGAPAAARAQPGARPGAGTLSERR